MTRDQFDGFLLSFMAICGALALFNVIRIRQRGKSAILLTLALGLLAGTVELYRIGAAVFLLILGAFSVVGVLVYDFVQRYTPKQPIKKGSSRR